MEKEVKSIEQPSQAIAEPSQELINSLRHQIESDFRFKALPEIERKEVTELNALYGMESPIYAKGIIDDLAGKSGITNSETIKILKDKVGNLHPSFFMKGSNIDAEGWKNEVLKTIQEHKNSIKVEEEKNMNNNNENNQHRDMAPNRVSGDFNNNSGDYVQKTREIREDLYYAKIRGDWDEVKRLNKAMSLEKIKVEREIDNELNFLKIEQQEKKLNQEKIRLTAHKNRSYK